MGRRLDYYMRLKYILLFFLAWSGILSLTLEAQQPTVAPGEEEVIKILHADYTYLEAKAGAELKILSGTVQLYHDSSFLYCDSARIDGLNVMAYGNVVIRHNDTVQIFADSLRYNGKLKVSDLFGEVILVSGGQSLYTRRLHYDLDSSIASYTTPGTLRTKNTVLKSKKGYFHVRQDMAYFYGQVQMTDPEIQLRSDSLQFNTKTQTAYFIAPTLMEKADRKIYCEGGYYDVDDKLALFTGNPQYLENDKKASSKTMLYDGAVNEIKLIDDVKFVSKATSLEGDTLLYNEKTRDMTIFGTGFITTPDGTVESTKKLIYNELTQVFITSGRSALQDSTNKLEADQIIRDGVSGNLTAIGDVHWLDTVHSAFIRCDSMFLDKKNNKVIAIGKGRQPLFKSFANINDTLLMRADTLVALQADTISKSRIILAYRHVQILRSDIQAVCDSMVYNEKDSLFTLYHNPVIWSDTSQFFADTIRLLQSGNQIKTLFLYQNAMIINSPDLKYFNQIKGRNIRAEFDSSRLATVDVLGNAEAVYYILDDEQAYIGVNKIICSHILARFESNQVDKIYFFTQPNGTMHPMRAVDHEKIKLKGFKWHSDLRPAYNLFLTEQIVHLR